MRHSSRDGCYLQAPTYRLLKKDAFGRTELITRASSRLVRRDASCAARPVRWLARRLLEREARALAVLVDLDGIPELLRVDDLVLEREYLAGVPMQVGKPGDVRYFHAASKLLRRLHRHGIAHNDLAKEPNLLVTEAGMPALIDFQLSSYSPRRSALFRLLAREDIRHLLKHKRTYCREKLTARERRILESPSWLSRLWMATGKPTYLFVTRNILGWEDREGAGDRV
ncbi:MAG: serine/threonine protein kinase [Gammaproteobacteria bacterium]|nr:serine/threonine protein kinase [Gammaproteobacteria bacterium]MDH5344190.1 serine/threonine protein kinase [Gammaproteobacteria bacterium]